MSAFCVPRGATPRLTCKYARSSEMATKGEKTNVGIKENSEQAEDAATMRGGTYIRSERNAHLLLETAATDLATPRLAALWGPFAQSHFMYKAPT